MHTVITGCLLLELIARCPRQSPIRGAAGSWHCGNLDAKCSVAKKVPKSSGCDDFCILANRAGQCPSDRGEPAHKLCVQLPRSQQRRPCEWLPFLYGPSLRTPGPGGGGWRGPGRVRGKGEAAPFPYPSPFCRAPSGNGDFDPTAWASALLHRLRARPRPRPRPSWDVGATTSWLRCCWS